MIRTPVRFVLAVVAMSWGIGAGAEQRDDTYRAEIEKWRQEREASLKADEGWLTVAGLFWLTEGENTFGAGILNDIILPAGSAPDEVGVFEFRGGKTTVRVNSGVTATMNGKPVRSADLKPDLPGPPDTIAIGDLTLVVHLSGERYGIRLRDKNSKIRREFAGLRWFPIDESYRIIGRFVPYDTPRKVTVPNIMGDLENYVSPGEVVFALAGQEFRMLPVQSASNPPRLWFVFRDLTSGKETYQAVRFLYADLPRDGKVLLDFNKAYNPPCTYNPFTTCPLPPEQNRLRVRIQAGELDYVQRKGT